jgi:hypothetical protein
VKRRGDHGVFLENPTYHLFPPVYYQLGLAFEAEAPAAKVFSFRRHREGQRAPLPRRRETGCWR